MKGKPNISGIVGIMPVDVPSTQEARKPTGIVLALLHGIFSSNLSINLYEYSNFLFGIAFSNNTMNISYIHTYLMA